MGKISPVLRRLDVGYAHWCPGCESHHVFYVDQPAPSGARWTFNGNPDAPSFTPSMVVTTGAYADDDLSLPVERCHYFLRDGAIDYLADCTHQLRGLTITLPELP